MIVVCGFYTRRADLTHQQFSAHWREVHGPLIRDTPEISRHIHRYVQHHVRPCGIFPGLQGIDYDGFSEIWFTSADELAAMRAEPVYAELVIPDLREFIGGEMTRVMVLDEPHTVI